MPTQEEILKSNEAELILNSETLQEALQNLKRRIYKSMVTF